MFLFTSDTRQPVLVATVPSTDEEIHGQYLDDIREYVNAAYTLVYDEEEKCSSINPGYFGGELV